MFVSVTLGLATCLTLFYFVHEQLPRFARATSALLLAPVAIADGLCYAAAIPGIYGKLVSIFTVNFVFAATVCGFGYLAASAMASSQHLAKRMLTGAKTNLR